MGLDIYLASKSEAQATAAYDKATEEFYEAWGDKDDSPEKAAAEKDLPAYVSHYQGSPSTQYPDHLFNRRYLRSSYNGSGFNRAVPDMVGEDHGLYWIFEPIIGDDDEPYETMLTLSHIQLLQDVKKRALQVAQEIKDSDPLRTFTANAMLGQADHMWSQLPTEEQVLAWYREEQATHTAQAEQRKAEGKEDLFSDGGYSNAKGMVLGFTKGEEVLAVTLGANPLATLSAHMPLNTLGGQMGLLPQAVVVYRMAEGEKDSYIQSAEIIAEFCDEAIDLIQADGSCYMHWSG